MLATRSRTTAALCAACSLLVLADRPRAPAPEGTRAGLAPRPQPRPRGPALPRCDRDPAATLRADLDPTPGTERVIADPRCGIAMFSATGDLLATEAPDGWTQTPGTRVELSALQVLAGDHAQLVVRTRSPGALADRLSVLVRRGATLERILDDDDEALERILGLDEDVPGRVTVEAQVAKRLTVPHAGAVVIELDGRARTIARNGHASPWRRVRDRCQIVADSTDDDRFVLLEPRTGDHCGPYDEDP